MITELKITWDDQTGAINVNGPVMNKMLCYGLLQCARDAIKDNVDKQQQNVVLPAPEFAPDSFVRNNRKRK